MKLRKYYLKAAQASILTLILLISANTSLFSQKHFPVNKETEKFEYSKVIFLDSVGKAELFTRATNWFTGYFAAGEIADKVVDEENGTITCTVNKVIEIKKAKEKMEVPLSFSFNIYIKGGRCKYEFTDIVFENGDLPAEEKFKRDKLNNTDQQYLSKTKRTILPIEKSIIEAVTLNSGDAIVRRYKEN